MSTENQDDTSEPTDPVEAAGKIIGEANAIIPKDGASIEVAIEKFDAALKILADESIEETDEKLHVHGWAEMGKANFQSNSGTSQGIEEAIQGYQRALKLFEAMKEPNPSHKADTAAVWGNIGHTQTRVGTKKVLEQATDCFLQSISILEELPWKENARYRHQLAATWLNLGNSLARQSNPAKPTERTVDAFEKAREIIGDLPVEDVTIGSLVASIHSSFGRAIMWSTEKSNLDQAVSSFEETIRVIAGIKDKKDPRLVMEMASAHANRANLLSRAPVSKESIEETLSSGEFALKMAAPNEKNHLFAAEISLSARRSICHAFGIMVEQQTQETKQQIHDRASDLLEDGLKLVKLWEERGADGLRPAAQHLFHLGCAFYCTQQPHFLPEFINENLDTKKPNPVMLESAKKTITEALSRIEKADASESEVANVLRKTLKTLEA